MAKKRRKRKKATPLDAPVNEEVNDLQENTDDVQGPDEEVDDVDEAPTEEKQSEAPSGKKTCARCKAVYLRSQATILPGNNRACPECGGTLCVHKGYCYNSLKKREKTG